MSRFISMLILSTTTFACSSKDTAESSVPLRYVGSSTVAHFLKHVEGSGTQTFSMDTIPESAGGERAILAGTTDIAGVAREPSAEVIDAGIVATPLGHDFIASIVHESNPVRNLTCDELAGIFSGRIRSWSEVGGPDLEIHPWIVGPDSATRKVFRSATLGASDYSGCKVVSPDVDMLDKVSQDPGAIGQISILFLKNTQAVKPLDVDGESPQSDNDSYPIRRPLYLLSWPGRTRVSEFIEKLDMDQSVQRWHGGMNIGQG